MEEFKPYIKQGWILNPSQKIVEGIKRALIRTEGECPCANIGRTREDRMCPCREYRENDHCCCNLYVRTITLKDLSRIDPNYVQDITRK